MQYFVRTMEKHKASTRVFSPELPCPALGSAKDAAKQLVQSSDPSVMLQADVCSTQPEPSPHPVLLLDQRTGRVRRTRPDLNQ